MMVASFKNLVQVSWFFVSLIYLDCDGFPTFQLCFISWELVFEHWDQCFPRIFVRHFQCLAVLGWCHRTETMSPSSVGKMPRFCGKIVPKCLGKLVNFLVFFFCQVPPFDSNSLQVIVSLLLFQEGQRLFWEFSTASPNASPSSVR